MQAEAGCNQLRQSGGSFHAFKSIEVERSEAIKALLAVPSVN
jgi:hypothetical protein